MSQPKQDRREILVWCHATPIPIESGVFEDHQEPRSLVRFSGPIREEWKEALTARGIRIEFWAPPFGACVTLPDGLRPPDLSAFPFLEGAVAYRQENCQRQVEPQSESERAAAGLLDGIVDVVCFGREARPRVEEQLRLLGIPILSSSSSKIRVHYTGDLARLRDLEGVKIADPARAPIPLAAAPAGFGLAPNLPPNLDGRGEILAVADTGLDVGADGPGLHRDFQGRIEAIASWPTNPSWSPFLAQPGLDDGASDRNTGHGTHVAGLAVGDGSACGGRHRGAAPAARLVFQALEHYCAVKPAFASRVRSGFYLSGRPLDLRELFQQARDRGARIHVNSWGDPARGAYTDDCFEADLFLREHPDAVLLFAAGNDGADRDGDGRIEPGSLYAAAAAKNVIAIGATEGPSETAGLRRTWGELDPQAQRFRHALDRREPISGEPDRIACFSSAGPTADGRIKPDLCAPGTNLAGPRSSVCSGRGWGLASPLPRYMYDGGTSAATGLAGGLTALVRQAWREANGGRPISGAALKAVLILGAQPVRGRAGFGRALPSEAGHGRLDVAASLPRQPGRPITIVDETAGLKTGDERLYAVQVKAGASLRAVLCWYDAPGERLINDLDLSLLHLDGPDGVMAPRIPDRANTVEVLDAPALAAGRYLLKVSAFNVPAGPQPFALAVWVAEAGPAS
ncbi:MAG: S8 family serine peptidase [Acidobacteriota bacterium]